METFHYNDCGDVIVSDGETVGLNNLSKKSKTRTLTRYGGWSLKINTSDIKISPSTYWRMGRYDHQLVGYDFYCYLCNYAGTTPSKCKCKKSFTVEEHKDNVVVARKNFLLSVIDNYFKDLKKQFKALELTGDVVDKFLFIDAGGVRQLAVDYPPVFDSLNGDKVKNIYRKHIDKILKLIV